MPEPSLYTQIEARYGFNLPQEYRQLSERGWLTLDRPAANISTVPGDGYLYLCDMEWYSLEDIVAFEFPEYCEPHLPHLVPFAFTGGGDYWCWQTDMSDHRGTRVLLCPHDSNSAVIYAPSFATALYRQALQYASSEVDGTQVGFAEGQAFLRRWSVDLAFVLPAEWCRVLAELAARPPFEWSHCWGRYTSRQTSFLSPDELRQIEARDLQFAELDRATLWSGLD